MSHGDHVHTGARRPEALVSVVVPAYNEAAALPRLYERLSPVMDGLPGPWELVVVNDGSTDDTRRVLDDLHSRHPGVVIVDLSRNFGKEIALTAGLDHARGDAVVVIDADLQDPPELIPELLAAWRDGADVAYGQRRSRAGESWLKRVTSHAFYRVMQFFGPVQLPIDTGDFRVMSRSVVDSLLRLREQHRFMKGLFAWVGYRQVPVRYDRDPRVAGASKWSYWRLWNLSIEGLTSFTVAPLKAAMYLGFFAASLAFCFGAWIIAKTLLFGEPVPGYPTIMVTVLFLGGAQLIALGIIGEYLGRIFNETKNRPLYLAREVIEPRDDGDSKPRGERPRPEPPIAPDG